MGHRNTDTNKESEERLLGLMDEYIDSYKAVVTEAQMFPVNFPILTRITVYFAIGNDKVYIFYEQTASAIPGIHFIFSEEQSLPPFKELAKGLIGSGILSNPSGFILPRDILEMSPEKKTKYLSELAENHARNAVEQVRAGDTSGIIEDLLRLQENANKILGSEVFIDKFTIINDLFRAARNLDEFSSRIQNLNLLIDKIRTRELKDLIGDDKADYEKEKSIKLLEKYLIKRGIKKQLMGNTLKNLRDISTLSAGYPRHEGKEINKRVNKIIQSWGFNPKKVNYPGLWKSALDKYKEFFQDFIRLLSD